MSAARGASPAIVGREAELATLHEFVARQPAALLLKGGPGIGKTTLWEASVAAARDRHLRILSARPSGAEAQLAFAAVADLLDDLAHDELTLLPAPQLHALEVALLRTEPAGLPPEQHAISLGFLNALRTLAAGAPLLVAIDDVQWLDPASAEVLVFAARRLENEPVGFLLTGRSNGVSLLERTLDARGLERLDIGALSLGATRRLLVERLGLTLSRHALRRIFAASGGNPLFALELGRSLAERGPLEIGDELPLPDVIEELMGARVKRLPAPVRRLLLAVALSGDLRTTQLTAIAPEAAVDAAVESGILVVDGERVRASHPLLPAVARAHSRAADRRQLHRELAGSSASESPRARHLALATARPDAPLASIVAAAAASAAARGAVEDAVELAEHALRLTPPQSSAWYERVLVLADHLLVAGKLQRLTDLLSPLLDSFPSGPARARAHLMLSEGSGVETLADVYDHLDRALAESGGDVALWATVVARKAEYTTAVGVEQIGAAEAAAVKALPAARRAGADVERHLLFGLGWARVIGGRPIDDLCERFLAVTDEFFPLTDSLDRLRGVRLAWRGDLDEARAILQQLISVSDERGEALSVVMARLHLCELELRAGGFAAAAAMLEEWEHSAEDNLLGAPVYQRCRALLAAGRGLPAETERWAEEAISGAQAAGTRWDMFEAQRARALAAVLTREPARAVGELSAIWDHIQREGVGDPAAFPVAPDLVEALAELGELEAATAVTDRFAELGEDQAHPWALVSARRCRALVALASGTYDTAAAEALAESAAAYGELGFSFDRARALLALGRWQRRFKKRGAARRSLGDAAAAFDEIDAPGWAELARTELDRVGARRPSAAGELTPSERRVVELAADGLSNKEIAQALFVTVHTVEAHLSHAYAKLGVRSRAQLPRRLSES